jgi:hypothetical protein
MTPRDGHGDGKPAVERWRCPNNHRAWELHGDDAIYCAACARHHDAEPTYGELLDADAGATVPVREAVRADVSDHARGDDPRFERLASRIRRVGNSLGMTLSPELLDATGLEVGDRVRLSTQPGEDKIDAQQVCPE